MSAAPGIRFERVWKKFRRGVAHDSLRDLIPAVARRLAGRAADPLALGRSDFWALREVSFTVAPGEALGIIGPNGAGKSTALKLLTRVLGPTLGRCEVRGRIGALVEVSAGFHPDLTGRENVFLQGAIMGMTRDEIRRRFDRIVAFAEVDAFIDTPVKRYSSGMQARLGFAIAAHLEPEVLIIDEVLAVGDAAFQKKALARVAALVRREIPVVIVTHQLDQVTRLCTKALVLDRGTVVAEGAPAECITAYLARTQPDGEPNDGAALTVREVRADARAVVSGESFHLAVSVGVPDLRRAPEQALRLRVASALTGAVLHEADLAPPDGTWPVHSSWLWLDARVTAAVEPGPYQLEVLVLDRESGAELGSGSAYLTVLRGPAFRGEVRVALATRVSHASEFDPEQDYRVPERAGAAW